MTEIVFIRAEIQDVLPSGQYIVHLLANNADGFVFYTDDKSIVRPEEIETTAIKDFWSDLQKISIAKGKEKPTLEELLEYIEQVKAEAIEETIKAIKKESTSSVMVNNGKAIEETRNYLKKDAIYQSYNSHDCEAWYKCPVCNNLFSSWNVFGQPKNENGTNKYCPKCKTELNGLD